MHRIVASFRPALPEVVCELVDAAERGEGPAWAWLAGDRGVSLVECSRMLNEPRVPIEVVGWLVAMTMFREEREGGRHQQLAIALGRSSFRDAAIPVVLEGFAIGLTRAGQTAGARLWTSIEMLAGRIPASRIPPQLLDALPIGLASPQAVVRGSALRLAAELDARAVHAAIEAVHEKAPSRALADALVALSGGEPRPATDAETETAELLARALAAWRETHDPRLEKPIARIGADLARMRGPIEARSRSELDGAWIALARKRDPVDLSRLLDAPWPVTWKRALERVDALAGFDPDPRLARRLVEVARGFSSAGSLPLHRRIAQVIARSPTPTIEPSFDALAAGREPLRAAYAPARAAVVEIEPGQADPALISMLRAGERDDVDVLFAQVAAQPDDVEARAVLADALQLVGDPRGELIALQLAIADGTASAGAERRAHALLAAHADAWTGPLPGIDRASRTFERGFLTRVSTRASGEAIARSLDRPEWATLEQLEITADDVELAPLLDRMPVLRRLCADRAALERLVEAGPRAGLRAVFSRGVWIPPPGAFPDLQVLGGTAFPGLYGFDALVRVQRDAAELGIEAVVHVGVRQLAAMIAARAAGPPETRITLFPAPATFDPPGWRLRVFRDDPPVTSTGAPRPIAEAAWVYHRYHTDRTAELFEPLAAAGIQRVALWFPDALRADRDRVVAERPFGVEIVPGEPIDLVAPA